MWPEWLSVAYQELRRGVREVPGPAHNPRILEYHQATTLKATTDEVPWCAAFVGWALSEAHVKPTGSAAARSYLTWGVGVSPVHPPLGAVMVLKRGGASQPGPEVLDAQGHAGFFFGHGQPGEFLLLSGNTGDALTLEKFSVHRLLGVRWPR